jgi:hypothetical protein
MRCGIHNLDQPETERVSMVSRKMTINRKIKFRRTRNREYATKRGGVTNAFRPSEYAVYAGRDLLARIVYNGDGWRVCRTTNIAAIGEAISPIGLNRFREVRAWVMCNFTFLQSAQATNRLEKKNGS